MYVAGFADQPAATVSDFVYSGPKELLNAVSAAGHVLMLVVTIAAVLGALKALSSGPQTGSEWGGDR
jgi:hypothetical protein